MAIEIATYDIIYGKLLSLNFSAEHATELAKTLYQISKDLNLTINEILKYVTIDGLRFENEIYNRLNQLRSNSSRLGFFDQTITASSIAEQLITTPSPSPESPEPTPEIDFHPTNPTWTINVITGINVRPTNLTWTITVTTGIDVHPADLTWAINATTGINVRPAELTWAILI